MKYIVLETFTDLQDNKHRYFAGDEFPRKGLNVSDSRIEELLTSKNRRERPMIKAVEEEEVKPEVTVKEVKPEAPVEEKKPVTKKTTTKKGKKKADAE